MDEKGKPPEKSQPRLVYTDEEVFRAARYAIEIGRRNEDKIRCIIRKVDELDRYFKSIVLTSSN